MSNYACYKYVPPAIRCMTTKIHKSVDCNSLRYPNHNLLNVASAAVSALAPIRNGNYTNKASFDSKQLQLLLLRSQKHPSPTSMRGTSFRSYSTTTPISLAIGRRRRQQISGGFGGVDDESTTKTDAVTTNSTSMNVKMDQKVFLSLVTSLFDTVHQAMVPLVPINEVMILTRGESSLAMREEQERREYEERKKAKKEMKDKNKDTSGKIGSMDNNNTNDNDDDPEPISVQSIGGHRVIDGPYLKIELGPIHGQYSFIADVEFSTVLFQSPMSGQFVYFYDLNNTNEWINVHDQHNLLGMFVRDIIRQIQGVPKI